MLLALGQARRAAGDLDGALDALGRAADLIPMAVGPDSPRALLIEIALEQGDRERAMAELEALLGHDHTDVEAARRLAGLAEEAGDTERQWKAHGRVIAIDPFDGNAHGALGRLAMARADHETAVREFRAALATDPVDRAEAYCDLAEGYFLAGRLADAKAQVLAALEMAPRYERHRIATQSGRGAAVSRQAAIGFVGLLGLAVAAVGSGDADAQVPMASDGRFGGLEWTFARCATAPGRRRRAAFDATTSASPGPSTGIPPKTTVAPPRQRHRDSG